MPELINVEAEIPDPQKQKPEKIKKQSQLFETMKRLRKNKAATLGLLITIVFFLLAIFAPAIAPYGYREMTAAHSNATPSAEHIFGCDDLGRDIFSRVLFGARWSIGLGLAATAFGLVFGIILGCIAGYYGGFVENLIMRISDVLQSIPSILLQIISATPSISFWSLPSTSTLMMGSVPEHLTNVRPVSPSDLSISLMKAFISAL